MRVLAEAPEGTEFEHRRSRNSTDTRHGAQDITPACGALLRIDQRCDFGVQPGNLAIPPESKGGLPPDGIDVQRERVLKHLRLKHQVQHPEPVGHRMLRWTDDTSTSTARAPRKTASVLTVVWILVRYEMESGCHATEGFF